MMCKNEFPESNYLYCQPDFENVGLIEMAINNSEERNKRYENMRAIKDYGMGALYLAIGFFMFFPEKVGFDMVDFDKLFRYMFGGISVLYGVWRIYRGYKKDYFR